MQDDRTGQQRQPPTPAHNSFTSVRQSSCRTYRIRPTSWRKHHKPSLSIRLSSPCSRTFFKLKAQLKRRRLPQKKIPRTGRVRRRLSNHRSHVDWRPKLPGQIEFGPAPTHAGPAAQEAATPVAQTQIAWPSSGTDMNRLAAARWPKSALPPCTLGLKVHYELATGR
jgi:hypothetical protein